MDYKYIKHFLLVLILIFICVSANSQEQQHVVKRGETFATIAKKYGITEQELKQANASSSVCYIGRKLLIPESSVSTKTKAQSEEETIENKALSTPSTATSYQTDIAFQKKGNEKEGMQWALQGTVTNEPFHSGMAVYKENINGIILYGAINTSGEVVIKPQFNLLGEFHNGMSIAKKDKLYGIISASGHWILSPTYEYISYNEENGFYEVRDKDKNIGLFYNGQFVIPIQYKSVSSYGWPFCGYEDEKGDHYSLNILTGDLFEGYFSEIGNIHYIKKNDKYLFFDNDTGERVDDIQFMKSSKGIEAFKDERTNCYGFRNSISNIIITSPHYHTTTPFWINDVMLVYDSLSAEIPYHSVVIGADGKVILSENNNTFYEVKGNYITGFMEDKKNSTYLYSLYTLQGKSLISPQKAPIFIIKGTKDWFISSEASPRIFDAVNGIYYSGDLRSSKVNTDGILKIENRDSKNEDEKFYYIDINKRKKLPGQYRMASEFSEGIAYVEQGDYPHKKYLIDRSGKIIQKLDSKIAFNYKGFSEGVIGIEDRSSFSWVKGYVYNPLGHNGYIYQASSDMKVDDNLYNKWMEEGMNAYEKEHWGNAKDLFYRVMMYKPNHVEALTYYGGCLNNLGYYEEAIEAYDLALDINPNYPLAKEWKEKTQNNILIKEEQEKRNAQFVAERKTEPAEQSNMFWNALNNFANMLEALDSSNSNVNSNNNANYSPSKPLSKSSKIDSSLYQEIYQKWTKLAEDAYNSLTLLGYRIKESDGSHSGSTMQSMTTGTYMGMKKNLRNAQREMRNTRREAASNGIIIPQSKWETATVSY